VVHNSFQCSGNTYSSYLESPVNCHLVTIQKLMVKRCCENTTGVRERRGKTLGPPTREYQISQDLG
jgi:hypothetical protein